jgi:hypothetical protein
VVCSRWKTFDGFLEDMGQRPTKDHTIERMNNDGPYTKSNCCWATRKTQARNRSSTRLLTLNGKTQCYAAWAEEMGLSQNTIYNRLRIGWSVDEALTMRPSPFGRGIRNQEVA